MVYKTKEVAEKFEKRDYHQEITDKLIASFESAEKLEWKKPWFVAPPSRPYNPVTGTKYSGINLVSIAMSGFQDPRWLTFNNMREFSIKHDVLLKVRKGEKGTPVFKAIVKEITEDKNGNLLNEPRKMIFMAFSATVFNAEQIENMPALEIKQHKDFTPNFAAEELLSAAISRTNLTFNQGGSQAFYRPSDHLVNMPPKESFESEARYYDTLAHELGHATGPALNRKQGGFAWSEEYAYEELIAELSSSFISAELGLEHDQYGHDQHAAYIKSWLGVLKNDKNYIFKAANAASRSTNYQMEHLRENLYGLNENHSASPAQNALLESLGVPERILKQIQTQHIEETQQVISTVVSSVETLPTKQAPKQPEKKLAMTM